MTDYAALNRAYRRQKTALTRAINSGDPQAILRAVNRALDEWTEAGPWPDAWARWEVATHDVYFSAQRTQDVEVVYAARRTLERF
jgi:hypothetical protein